MSNRLLLLTVLVSLYVHLIVGMDVFDSGISPDDAEPQTTPDVKNPDPQQTPQDSEKGGNETDRGAVDNLVMLVVDLTTGETKEMVQRLMKQTLAAVNKQVAEDFAPVWNIHGKLVYDEEIEAGIRAFVEKNSALLPTDPDDRTLKISQFLEQQGRSAEEWKHLAIVYLVDFSSVAKIPDSHHQKQQDLKHLTDVPAALVFVETPSSMKDPGLWTETLSHEVLELLADPFTESLKEHPVTGEWWMVEVCDPIEATDFSYEIDKVRVENFITPNYFDLDYRGSVDFRGYLKGPFTIMPGGYAMFLKPMAEGKFDWYQWSWLGGRDDPVYEPVPKIESKTQRRRDAEVDVDLGLGGLRVDVELDRDDDEFDPEYDEYDSDYDDDGDFDERDHLLRLDLHRHRFHHRHSAFYNRFS